MTNKNLHGLYAITDARLIAEQKLIETIEQALAGGTSVIQYRDKSNDTQKRMHQAREIKLLCKQYNSTFIINDDIRLANEVDADGVHIGANDCSYEKARALLGDNKIIGITCYNQFETAIQAQDLGANYVAFGSFFSSSVKPNAVRADINLLTKAKQELSIPVCAIGGITLNNASELIHSGADMLAVISDIFESDNIHKTCEDFNQLFNLYS